MKGQRTYFTGLVAAAGAAAHPPVWQTDMGGKWKNLEC